MIGTTLILFFIIRKTKYPKLQNEMSKKNNGIKIGKAVQKTAFIFYKS